MHRYLRAAAMGAALSGLALPLLARENHDNRFDFQVNPRIFDPHRTSLVSSEWEMGTGCPTKATVRLFNTNPPYNLLPPSQYTDPACPTGDGKDRGSEGLVLVKTGPTLNDAAAVADLKGVKGKSITELGYDLRKPAASISDPRGSHCGAGAPRFDVVISGEDYFVGCASPPPTSDQAGNGWQRLRWGGGDPAQPLLAYPASGTCASPTVAAPGGLCDIGGVPVDEIAIVFDEGQDGYGAPDQFGAAVLDNIDVNTVLVGRGPAGEGNGGGMNKQ